MESMNKLVMYSQDTNWHVTALEIKKELFEKNDTYKGTITIRNVDDWKESMTKRLTSEQCEKIIALLNNL